MRNKTLATAAETVRDVERRTRLRGGRVRAARRRRCKLPGPPAACRDPRRALDVARFPRYVPPSPAPGRQATHQASDRTGSRSPLPSSRRLGRSTAAASEITGVFFCAPVASDADYFLPS